MHTRIQVKNCKYLCKTAYRSYVDRDKQWRFSQPNKCKHDWVITS